MLILARDLLARHQGKEFYFFFFKSVVFSPTVNRLNTGSENNCFRLFYSNRCGCWNSYRHYASDHPMKAWPVLHWLWIHADLHQVYTALC